MNNQEKKTITNAIKEAINFCGSRAELSRAIGVTKPMINHWLNFVCPVSIRLAFEIQNATDGKVKAKDLVSWLPPKSK